MRILISLLLIITCVSCSNMIDETVYREKTEQDAIIDDAIKNGIGVYDISKFDEAVYSE
mgnify:CR=1 FL=1